MFEPAIVPLPVNFTSVKAYQNDKNINVEWRVENEINIRHYAVEKSINGAQFTNIVTIPATANNGNSAIYHSADTHPVEGYNYYRIKSVDIDGTTGYTNVVKVLAGSIKRKLLCIQIRYRRYDPPAAHKPTGRQLWHTTA